MFSLHFLFFPSRKVRTQFFNPSIESRNKESFSAENSICHALSKAFERVTQTRYYDSRCSDYQRDVDSSLL